MAPRCRFCDASPEHQSIKGKNVYGGEASQHFWLCDACGIIYLHPPLDETKELEFYKKEFEKFMANRACSDMDWTEPDKHVQSNQREVVRRMPFLMCYLKAPQHVFEIGCSSGFMLSALKAKGFKVSGLDPSGGFIEYVRGKDIPIFQTVEELKQSTKASFDAIIHYYVYEHIRHPVDFIKQYMELLPKGGTMIFEVPCATDPLVELYKVPAFDDFYWSVAHHWYFSKESLSKVLAKTGFSFELFPDQRYDISNHMTWMLNGKPGGMGRWSEVFGEALDKQYKERLKELWLCDTIIAVIKKN